MCMLTRCMFLSAGVWPPEHPAVLRHGGPMGGSVQVRQGTNTQTTGAIFISTKGKELQQNQRTLHIIIVIVGCRSNYV